MNWHNIAYLLLAIFVCYLLYRYLKSNPGSLSKANLSKSARTLGLLALGLIAFIALLVMMLRN